MMAPRKLRVVSGLCSWPGVALPVKVYLADGMEHDGVLSCCLLSRRRRGLPRHREGQKLAGTDLGLDNYHGAATRTACHGV
jgi:hypothetical protein